MKKISLAALLMLAGNLFSQSTETPTAKKDTAWKTSGFFGLNISQTQLSNWQGGGQANTALNGILNYEAVWTGKNHEVWTTKFDGQYGILRQGYSGGFRKNTDQIFVLSKFSTKTKTEHLFYAAQADYRTQFAPGYVYDADGKRGIATSDFNSPAYIQLALGLEYRPTTYFSVLIAPVAGKITLVNRQYLADAGAYGVQKAVVDGDGLIVTPGRKVRYEAGGRVSIKFKKEIVKNLVWDSYLDLFSNYFHNPGNIDVVFNNLVTLKISKYFTASLICQMQYDDDITITRDLNKDGVIIPNSNASLNEFSGPRLQVLSTYGIGFGYKF
jgi:hypothetical protein